MKQSVADAWGTTVSSLHGHHIVHKGVEGTSNVNKTPGALEALHNSQQILENLEAGYNHLAVTKPQLRQLIRDKSEAINIAIAPQNGYVHSGKYIIEVNRRLEAAKKAGEAAAKKAGVYGVENKPFVAEKVTLAMNEIRDLL